MGLFRFCENGDLEELSGPTLYSAGWLMFGLSAFRGADWPLAFPIFASVSSYRIVGARYVLVLNVPIVGGFALIIMFCCVGCWFRTCLGSGFASIMFASEIRRRVPKKASIFNCPPTAQALFL